MIDKGWTMLADLVVPVLTPFAADGSIDDRALAAHTEWVLEEGASGVMLFGTTGEGTSITVDEKLAAARSLLAAVPGVQVVGAVTEASLSETIRCVRGYNELELQATLVLPPFYFRAAEAAGIEAYLDRAVAESEHPVLGYHIPSLAPAIRADYVSESALFGVKDSSGDPSYLQAVLATGKVVFVGAESLVPEAVAGGALGTIAGMGNLVPRHLAQVCTAVRAGDLDEADRLRQEVLAVQRAVTAIAPGLEFISAFKDIARTLHGSPMGDTRLPLLRHSTYGGDALAQALRAVGIERFPIA
jgi:4-hydroxy-tetrahydrodipicolinate synthase